jgi:hypothetical protein
MIWIVIIFVVGALLLTLVTGAFSGKISSWYDGTVNSWFSGSNGAYAPGGTQGTETSGGTDTGGGGAGGGIEFTRVEGTDGSGSLNTSWANMSSIAQAISADNTVTASITDLSEKYGIKVGDMMTVQNPADATKTIHMQIVAFNADNKADGSGKAAITWISKEIIAKHNMNGVVSNVGGWASSEMRTYVNSLVLKDTDGSIITPAPVNKTSYTYELGTDNDKTVSWTNHQQVTSDTVWIPSCQEVGFSYFETGMTYSCFTNSASRIKNFNGSASVWWLRSAGNDNGSGFRYANSSGDYYCYVFASDSYGVTIGFCM